MNKRDLLSTTVDPLRSALVEGEFPYPVASASRRARDAEKKPERRFVHLLAAAEALVQVVGSTIFADAQSEVQDKKASRALQKALASCRTQRSSLGLWLHCIAELTEHLQEPFLVELGELRRNTGAWGELVAALQIVKDVRNQDAHASVPAAPHELMTQLDQLEIGLRTAATYLRFMSEYRMVGVESCQERTHQRWWARLRPLHGADGLPTPIEVESACDLNEQDVLLIRPDGSEALLLSPLYLFRDGTDLADRLCVYDGSEVAGTRYQCLLPGTKPHLGAPSHHPRPERMNEGPALRRPIRLAPESIERARERAPVTIGPGAARIGSTGISSGEQPAVASPVPRRRSRLVMLAVATVLVLVVAGLAAPSLSSSLPAMSRMSAALFGDSMGDGDPALAPTPTPPGQGVVFVDPPAPPDLAHAADPPAPKEAPATPDEVGAGTAPEPSDPPPQPEAAQPVVDVAVDGGIDEDVLKSALEAHREFVAAFNRKDAVGYFGTYEDPVTCYYNQRDFAQKSVRDRRWKIIAETTGRYVVDRIEVAAAQDDAVVLKEQAHMERDGEVSSRSEKVLGLRRRDGRWRIALEADENDHGCVD